MTQSPNQDRVVAIHQPNYLPWLGYFRKIARADTFVFLDDVQFSKGSYINRVQVLAGKSAKWLSVPVTASIALQINQTQIAKADWRADHLARLQAYYRTAPAFATVFPGLEEMFASAQGDTIAAVNESLIRALAGRIGLDTVFVRSSDLGHETLSADERLAALVSDLGGTAYLSGGGGAKYQDPATFAAAGIALAFNDLDFAPYDQRRDAFVAGLSILDCLFWTGFENTARLVRGE